MSPVPLRIEIDQSLCLSSGKCVADAPHVFAFDDDEIATVIDPTTTSTTPTVLRIAAAARVRRSS